MAYKSFQDMIDTLSPAEAAGMDSVITLKPQSAGVLADILEARLDRLRANTRTIEDIRNDLESRQEPLGREFKNIILDHIDDLYES